MLLLLLLLLELLLLLLVGILLVDFLLLLHLLLLLLLLLELLLLLLVSILLVDFLLLLGMLLLQFLILLIMLLLQLLKFLRMLLLQLRIHAAVRPRGSRAVRIVSRVSRISVGIVRSDHVRFVGPTRIVGNVRVRFVGPIGIVRIVRRIRVGVLPRIHGRTRWPVRIRLSLLNHATVVSIHLTLRIRASVLIPMCSVADGHRFRGGRCNLHWGRSILDSLGMLRFDLSGWGQRDRSALIRLNGLLSLCERHRCGRWRRLGHYRAVLHHSGWLHPRCCASAKYSLLWWGARRCYSVHMRGCQLSLVDNHEVARNRLGRAKRLPRSGGHRSVHILVHILHVADVHVVHRNVLVHHCGVVIIVDHRLVHGRIRNVHVIHISPAYRIRRHKYFPRT